jgi:hypothetical protein
VEREGETRVRKEVFRTRRIEQARDRGKRGRREDREKRKREEGGRTKNRLD